MGKSIIGYVVMRYETPLEESPGVATCIEQVFICRNKAVKHKQELDPEGEGFEYRCPCGCDESHYRAWYVEPVIVDLEEE